MSILIKGVDAPKNCMGCWFAFTGPDFYYCHAPGRDGMGYDYSQAESIPEDCPIVAVNTPHGRLIDAYELQNKINKEQKWVVKKGEFVNEGYSSDQINFAIHFAPTIIEAED